MQDETRQGDEWEPKDAWLGLLLFVTGLLVCACVVLAWRNGFTGLFGFVGFPALAVGPVLVLIGLNGLVRALGGLRGSSRSERKGAGEQDA